MDIPVATTTSTTTRPKRMRVLSIQSQVVHGHVGNSAAAFPLQLLGVDVDCLNVLSFSNHTGYPLFKGHFITPEQFEAIALGLKLNGFTKGYQGVMSGFLGNAAMMAEVEKLVLETQGGVGGEGNGDDSPAPLSHAAAYVCDPVCGDNGRLYVAEACVEMYRSALLPLAAVATPNGFEASTLSGIPITNLSEARRAATWFHTVPKVPLLVIKSFHDAELDPTSASIFMLVSVSDCHPSSPTTKEWLLTVPKLDGYFVGTGDVFAGLLVGHFRNTCVMSPPSTASSNSRIGLLASTSIQAKSVGGARGEMKASTDDGAGDMTVLATAFLSCVHRAAAGTLGILENTQELRREEEEMKNGGTATSSKTNNNNLHHGAQGDASVVTESFDTRELMIVHSQHEMLQPPLEKIVVRSL